MSTAVGAAPSLLAMLNFVLCRHRSLHDSMCIVKRTLESKALVPGGGSVEAALSVYMESLADTMGTREQLAVAAFADALLIIPKTLAVNGEALKQLQPRTEHTPSPTSLSPHVSHPVSLHTPSLTRLCRRTRRHGFGSPVARVPPRGADEPGQEEVHADRPRSRARPRPGQRQGWRAGARHVQDQDDSLRH